MKKGKRNDWFGLNAIGKGQIENWFYRILLMGDPLVDKVNQF